jgi:hypothetical protein
MARNEVTSWLIGDSVPCRLSISVNGTPTNADSTPTIEVYDSTPVKVIGPVSMSLESTGEYVYYFDSATHPVGKSYYTTTATVSTVVRSKKSTFFLYDMTTWLIIEKIRDALDNLQEGELASVTIWDFYGKAQRWVTPEASASANATQLLDAIEAQCALSSYISYLTDRERAGDNIGTAAFLMLTELRLAAERALASVKRATKTKGEVTSGLFGTTESGIQIVGDNQADRGSYTAERKYS